jgi:hypothetical protein
MASTVFPAASAAAKTQFRTTLTSGTSYTVPANVTYLNVTLVGGGGGGAGVSNTTSSYGNNGCPGQSISSTLSATAGNSIAYAIGAGGAGGSSGGANNGSSGGTTTFTGATSATGGTGGRSFQSAGLVGTAGSYANNGGQGAGENGGGSGNPGGTGGAGAIYIEYWALFYYGTMPILRKKVNVKYKKCHRLEKNEVYAYPKRLRLV